MPNGLPQGIVAQFISVVERKYAIVAFACTRV